MAIEILSGVQPQDKGALDFPLSTARRDTSAFAKKIPNLQRILDYASKEQLSNDSSLLQVLTQMQMGTSRDWAALDDRIREATETISTLRSVLPLVVSESFVQIDLPLLNMPNATSLLSNSSSSKNEYDVWMRTNKKSIDAVRSAFTTGADEGMQQLAALLQTTDKVAGNTLRASLRAGILSQVAGSALPEVKISLCPVCHGLLEALNDRITTKYQLRKP
jgi:hypothetical protein